MRQEGDVNCGNTNFNLYDHGSGICNLSELSAIMFYHPDSVLFFVIPHSLSS